jgi:outer membrane lipoprotein-sorting protein
MRATLTSSSLLMLALACSCGGAEVAAPAGTSPGPVTLEAVLDRLEAQAKATEDLTADFTRTRTNPYSRRPPKVVTGYLVLKVPNMVKLVFAEPAADARQLYVNQQEAWDVRPRAKIATRVPLKEGSARGLSPEVEAFLAGMGRDIKGLKKGYDLKLEAVPEPGKDPIYEISAKAKESPHSPYYQEMHFWIDGRVWIPFKVRGTQPSRMVDTWEFTRIRTNTGVKDSEFKFRPPIGYTVSEESLDRK